MIPNKCKCNWVPSVLHIIDSLWGYTTDYQVICENCYRRGKKKLTREEAIEDWNINGSDETGIMK